MQSTLTICPRFRRLACLIAQFVVMSLVAGGPPLAAAQDDTPPGFRSYKLEHATAVEFGSQLRKLLAKSPGKPEVLVDKQQNRVLVQGNEEAHRVTAQLVAALDRPAKGDPDEANKARRVPRAEGGRHRLVHITWREFEDQLRHAWGGKLAITASQTGELATVQLPSPPDAAAVMQIDRARGEVSLAGPPSVIRPWEQVVRAIDSKRKFAGEQTELVPIRRTDPSQVQHAVTLVRAAMHGAIGDTSATVQLNGGAAKRKLGGDLISMIFQPRRPPGEQPEEEPPPEEEMEQPPRPVIDDPREGGLLGPVQIEFIEGLDTLVIRGNKRDVEKVLKIIEDIEKESEKTKPVIEVYHLRHTTSQTISDIVLQLYPDVLSARQGRVSITPLIKPNALLLIGREESVKAVIDLIERLDRPLPREAQFQVFQLKHLNALDAEALVESFFPTGQPGLAERVLVVAEPRSNALIVQGGPRDLAEVRRLIDKIDVNTGAKKLEMRVFKLKNSLAQELAPLLQNAILGRFQQGAGGQGLQQQLPQQTNPQVGPGQNNQQITAPSIMFVEVDPENNKIINSGVMADVIISADTRNNSLLVRAPPESMELIAALIRQLDGLPVAEAQIKVFTIINADATNLSNMLQQLFGTGQGQGQGQFQQNQAQFQSPTGSGESLLVQLRFAVDLRTNSIIATGSAGDLQVVEAILLRLDEGDLQTRKTTVYRLNNAPAVDVAASINQMLTNQRQLNQTAPNVVSQFERLEREVIVVPEIVSNSLIVSATPKYYDAIAQVVKELDARPPMVMIQVVIAEVTLDDTKELGVELGLQDSLLFNRGLAAGPAAAPVVGFPFNQANLGNDLTAGSVSLAQRALLGTQGLSNLGLGRTNTTLGYGGLIVSAGNDSINILMRALHDQRRLQVLSRPQVMTLNNQPAFVQVGQRVPYITQSTLSVNGTQNAVDFQNVGILLGVTPRTSPDGLVAMEVNAEKSAVGPEAEGIPISINAAGDVIRSPRIDITTAQTTVSAKSGQTVIFAGLITKNKSNITRRTPYLSDIPILGNLFRFDAAIEKRTELVIIMTPYVVRNEEDADWVKRMEADRMSWCLSDVIEVHQEGKGLSGNRGPWGSESMPMIYPDGNPAGLEPVPPGPPSGGQNQPELRPELMPPDRSGSSRRRSTAAGRGGEDASLRDGSPEPAPANFNNAKQPTPTVPTNADTTTKVWYGPAPPSAKRVMASQQDKQPVDRRTVAPANFETPVQDSRRNTASDYPQPARFPEVK